jgi:hypothetical protein
MMQQVQMQMMGEQQKQSWEDEGKIAKSVVDATGRLALQEKKGNIDLAVAAIQAEATKEKKTNIEKASKSK